MEVFSFRSQDTPDERIMSAKWGTVKKSKYTDDIYVQDTTVSLSDYPTLCDEALEIIGAFVEEYSLDDEQTSAKK